MESFEKPVERRKFMKWGISGGFAATGILFLENIHIMAIQPESFVSKHKLSQNKSYLKLLNIAKAHGGEFGAFKGGL